jgi:hypothetical protein
MLRTKTDQTMLQTRSQAGPRSGYLRDALQFRRVDWLVRPAPAEDEEQRDPSTCLGNLHHVEVGPEVGIEEYRKNLIGIS